MRTRAHVGGSARSAWLQVVAESTVFLEERRTGMMTVLERSLAEVSQELQVSRTPVLDSRGELSVCPFLGGRTYTNYAPLSWLLQDSF